jgi:DNA topoisomerase IB
MAKSGSYSSQKELHAIQKSIATAVSAKLGNSPSEALKSYIHPAVWNIGRKK